MANQSDLATFAASGMARKSSTIPKGQSKSLLEIVRPGSSGCVGSFSSDLLITTPFLGGTPLCDDSKESTLLGVDVLEELVTCTHGLDGVLPPRPAHGTRSHRASFRTASRRDGLDEKNTGISIILPLGCRRTRNLHGLRAPSASQEWRYVSTSKTKTLVGQLCV